MRGLACLLMFQTHCYDAWLAPAWRGTTADMNSVRLGTFPAPMFLFLAGFAVALGIDRMEARGATRYDIAKQFLKRGAEVFGIAMLFRGEQVAMSWGWSPWTDLLHVDILNTIGISLMLGAVVPLLVEKLWQRIALAASIATIITLITPPLWTTHRQDALPWWLATYIDGGGIERVSRGWAFPIFPWTGFLFTGVAIGLIVMRARRNNTEGRTMAALAAAGVVAIFISRWLDHMPWQFYPDYNYWLTSPEFFLARVGCLLGILAFCYLWCWIKMRMGIDRWWSPLEQLGMTSLLVYWVHIDLTYGRFSILTKRGMSFTAASWGLAVICVTMTLLSLLKTRLSRAK